jgi:hypothetical protein
MWHFKWGQGYHIWGLISMFVLNSHNHISLEQDYDLMLFAVSQKASKKSLKFHFCP